MKIAITGGIGSGKSAVAAVIRRSGYKVVSADEAYRRISGRADYLSAVKKLFPDAVKGESPALDRAVLAAEVFADGKKRAALNELAHPLIMKEMFEEAKGERVAFFEVPLLFEGGYEDRFDKVIVVMRDEAKRAESVCVRSGMSMEQAKARMRAQVDYGAKDLSGNYVLQNDGDLAALERATQRALHVLLGKDKSI